MDNVNGSKSRLGSINWSVIQGGTRTEQPAPTDSSRTEQPTATDSSRPSPGDTIDLRVPHKGASGQAVKDQVLRVDGELSTLDKALLRNQEDLSQAQFQRAALKDALASKIQQATDLSNRIGSAEGDKAQIAADISAIQGQIAAADQKIAGLGAEQESLLKHEAELASRQRTQYDQANGAQNYYDYLKGLPEEERGDGALEAARKQAAGDVAKHAREGLKQTEEGLADTNAQEAAVGLQEHFLHFRRFRLEAQGDAKAGDLDATQQQIDRMKQQKSKVDGDIKDTRGEIAQADGKIARTEKTIDTLQQKISELEQMRDKLINDALRNNEADAKALTAKIGELESAISKLQGDLASTKKDLADLKELKDAHAR